MACQLTFDYVKSRLAENKQEDSNLINAIVGLFNDETEIIPVNIGGKSVDIIKLSNGSLINLETLNSNIEILLDKEKGADVTRVVKRAYNSLFSNALTKEEKKALEDFIKENGSYTSFNYAINRMKNDFYTETNFFVLDRGIKEFIEGTFSFNSFVNKLSAYEQDYQEYLQNKQDAKYANINDILKRNSVIDVSSLSDKEYKKLVFNIQMGMLYDAHKKAIAMNQPSPLSAFYKYFLNEIERPDIYEKEKNVNEVRKVDENTLDKGDIEERSDVLEDMLKEEVGRTTSQEVKNHIGNIPVINNPTIISVSSNGNIVTQQIQVTSKDRNTGNYDNYDEKYMHHILIDTYKKANEQYIRGDFPSFRDALLYNLLYDNSGNLNDMSTKKNKAKLSFALRFFAEATESLDIVQIQTTIIKDDEKKDKILTIKLFNDDLYLQPLRTNNYFADIAGFTEQENDRKLYFNYYNVINAINGYFLSTNKSNYVRIDMSEGSKEVDVKRAEYTTDVAAQEPHRVIQNFFFKNDEKKDKFRNPIKRRELLNGKNLFDVPNDIYINAREFVQKLISRGVFNIQELINKGIFNTKELIKKGILTTQGINIDVLAQELEAYINETDFSKVISEKEHIIGKQIVRAFANTILSELNVSIESVTEIAEEENNQTKREFIYPFSALLFSREDIQKANAKAELSDNVADYAIFYDIIKTFLGNPNNYFSNIYGFSTDENLVVSFVGMKEKDMKNNKNTTKKFKQDKLYKPRISIYDTLNGNGYVLLDGTEDIDKPFATILYPKNEYRMQTISAGRGNIPIFNLSSIMENLEWVDEVFPYLPYKEYYRILEITTGRKDEAKSYKELTAKDRFLTMLRIVSSGYGFTFTPANKSINYLQKVEEFTDEYAIEYAIDKLQDLQLLYLGHTYYAYTGERFTETIINENNIKRIRENIDNKIIEINNEIIKIGDVYQVKKTLYEKYGLLENIDYELVSTKIGDKTTYSIKFPESLKLYTASEALALEKRFEELSAKGNSLSELEKAELASIIEKQRINHFAKTANWFNRYNTAFANKLDELADKFLTAGEKEAFSDWISNAKRIAIGDYVASQEEIATTFHSPFDTKTKAMTNPVELSKRIIARQLQHTLGDIDYLFPTPVVVREDTSYRKEAILDENKSNQYLEIQKEINKEADKSNTTVRDGTIFISPFFSKILRVTHRINAEGIAKLGISAITNRGTNFFGKGATITLSRTLMDGDFSGEMQKIEDRMLGETLSTKLKSIQSKKKDEVLKELSEIDKEIKPIEEEVEKEIENDVEVQKYLEEIRNEHTALLEKINRRNKLIKKLKNKQIRSKEREELKAINKDLLSTIENNTSFINLQNKYKNGKITELEDIIRKIRTTNIDKKVNNAKNRIKAKKVKEKLKPEIIRKRNEVKRKYDRYIRNQEDYDDLVKWYLSTKEELNRLIKNNDEIGKMLSEHIKSLYANNNKKPYKNRYEEIISNENISQDIKDFITALSEFTAFYMYGSASKTYNAFINKGNDMVKTYLSPYSYGEVTNLVASDGVITTIPAPTQANYILSSNEVLETLSELQNKGYESYKEDFYLDPNLEGEARKKRLKEIEDNIKTALITKYELAGEFEKVNALLNDSINIHYPGIIDSVSQELTKKIKRKIATPDVRGQRYAIADGTGMYRLLEYNGNLYTVSDALRLKFISETQTEEHTTPLPNSKYYALEEVANNGKVRDLQPSKILLNGKELRGEELREAINNIRNLNEEMVKLSPNSIAIVNTILEEGANINALKQLKEIEAKKLNEARKEQFEKDKQKELSEIKREIIRKEKELLAIKEGNKTELLAIKEGNKEETNRLLGKDRKKNIEKISEELQELQNQLSALEKKQFSELSEAELNELLDKKLSNILNLAQKVLQYTITPFEVVLPFEARGLFGIDSNLTLQQARERLKNNPEKLKAFEEYVNRAIATRIPTSSFASLQPIRIVAFANDVNNLAILPHEQLAISGADTDGDTISIEYVHINNDGTLAEDEIATKNVRNKYKTLSNPSNFVKLMTPIDNSILEEKAKDERKKIKDEFSNTYGFLNFFTKLNSQIQNLSALKLVGIFVKFNQIYSYYGMLIKNGIVSSKLPRIKFNGKEYDTFAFYGNNGIEIQETINQLVNAALDDAKYNYSGILNINNATANFINILLMYGVPFNEILDFINKPHIKDLAFALNNYNSIDAITLNSRNSNKNDYKEIKTDEEIANEELEKQAEAYEQHLQEQLTGKTTEQKNAETAGKKYYFSKRLYRLDKKKEISEKYNNDANVLSDLDFFNKILDFETSITRARNIVSLASFKTNLDSTFDTIKPLIKVLTGENNSSFIDLLGLDIDKSISNLGSETEELLKVNALLSDIPLFRNIMRYIKEDIANRSRFLTFFSEDALKLFKETHTGEDNTDSYIFDKKLFSKFLDFLSQKFAIDYLNSKEYKNNKINSHIDVLARIQKEVETIKSAKAKDEKVANFMNKYVITGDTNVDDFTAYYNRIRSSALTDIERFQIQEAFDAIDDTEGSEGRKFKDAFFRYALLTKGFSKSYKSLLPLISDKYLKKLSDFAREYNPDYKSILKDKEETSYNSTRLSAFLDSYALFNTERPGKLFGKNKMKNAFVGKSREGFTYPMYGNNGELTEIINIPYNSINYSIVNKYLANPLYYNTKKTVQQQNTNITISNNVIAKKEGADLSKQSESVKNNVFQLVGSALSRLANNLHGRHIVNEAIDFVRNQLEKIGIEVEIEDDISKNYRGHIKSVDIIDENGNKIGTKKVLVLNMANINLDTPFHELAHIDILLMEKLHPEKYKKFREAILSTKVYEDTKAKYEGVYKTEEEIIQEAMAEVLGYYVAKQYKKLYEQNIAKSFVDVLFATVKDFFDTIVRYVRPLIFGHSFVNPSVESFAIQYAKDVLSGRIERDIEELNSLQFSTLYQIVQPTTVIGSIVAIGGNANIASDAYIENLYKRIKTNSDLGEEVFYNGKKVSIADLSSLESFKKMVYDSTKNTLAEFAKLNEYKEKEYEELIDKNKRILDLEVSKKKESDDNTKEQINKEERVNAMYQLSILSMFDEFNPTTDRIHILSNISDITTDNEQGAEVLATLKNSGMFKDSNAIIRTRKIGDKYYVHIINTAQEGLKKQDVKYGSLVKKLMRIKKNGLVGKAFQYLERMGIGVDLDDSLETTLSMETIAMAMVLKQQFGDKIVFDGMGILPLNDIKQVKYKEIMPNEYIEAFKQLHKYAKIKGTKLFPEQLHNILEQEKITQSSNYVLDFLEKLIAMYHKREINLSQNIVLEKLLEYRVKRDKQDLSKAIRYRINDLRRKIKNVDNINYNNFNNDLEREYYYLIRLYTNLHNQGREAYNSLLDTDSLDKLIRTDIENKNPFFQWVFDAWYRAKLLVLSSYKVNAEKRRKVFAKYVEKAKEKYGKALTRYEGKYYENLFKYIEVEKDGKKYKVNTFRLLNESDKEWKSLEKWEQEFIKDYKKLLKEMLIQSVAVQRDISIIEATNLVNNIYANIEDLVPVMRITTETALFSGELTGALETSLERMINRAEYYNAENQKDYEAISNYLYNQLYSFSVERDGKSYGNIARRNIIGLQEDGTWDVDKNKDVSLDLLETLSYFDIHLQKKRFMEEVNDLWHIARSMLQVREAKTGLSQKNNIELLNSFIKRKLYGERLTFSETKIANTIERTLLLANNLTSYLALGFNYASNMKAFVGNTMNIVLKTLGNRKDVFGEKELMMAMKEVATSPRKALMLAEEFGYINYSEMDRALNKRISGTDNSLSSSIRISNDIPFVGDKISDYYNKLTVMVAQMIKDGVWDSIILEEEDNRLYIRYDSSKDKRPKELIKYVYDKQVEQGLIRYGEKMKYPYDVDGIKRIDVIINRVSGTLTESSETLAQTTVIGKSLMKFKVFSVPYINKVLKQKGVNFNYKIVEYKDGQIEEIYPHEESMYMTLLRSIGYIMNLGVGKGIEVIKDNMSEEERSNLMNIAVNMVSLGLLFVLQKIADDDEENRKRRRKYGKDDFIYRVFNDALNDLSMFGVFSTGASLNIASISILKRFAGALFDLMTLDLDRGTRGLVKSVGALNSAEAMYRMFDKEGYSSYREELKRILKEEEENIKEEIGIEVDE